MASLLSVGAYQWMQHYGRSGQDLNDSLDEALGLVKAAGFDAWEPTLGSAEETRKLADLLAKHGLQCPSVYFGGTLHTETWKAVVDDLGVKLEAAKGLGIKVIACNPDPIDWNNPQDKTDEQLRTQAAALREMCRVAGEYGAKIGYHVHTPELRQGAREMTHMLLATKDAGMGFCLDTHWVYRACGDSHVALEDITALYADRVVSVHVRQSQGGVWGETLGKGDIDHALIFSMLKKAGFDGPWVCETAYEEGTPETMSIGEAYKISAAWLRSAVG